MAISTNSKRFLSAPLTQSVVNDIYSGWSQFFEKGYMGHRFGSLGRVVFSTKSRQALVADNYKQRQIEIYDRRAAPFLDHYRYEYLSFPIICNYNRISC